MTKKTYLFALLLISSLFAAEIPTQKAKEINFGKSVELNSQIIQLSNASQSVTSQISGHLEKYFIIPGQRVKAGQKIALIKSIEVSKMTADFISLKKQYVALKKNYEATKKLYDGGMTSMQELNNQSMQKNAMLAQINALKSQLDTLNIDTNKLQEATPNFILYAHSSGKVSQLLQALHTVVLVDEAVIKIVKEQAFYIKSFVPLEYASAIKVGQKMIINYNNRNIITHVTQVLPSLDEATQRIILLSSVDEKADDLYINSYVKSTLYFKPDHTHVAVKKSALSFFNNEWVVFVPKKDHDDHEEDKHDEHDENEHDELNGDNHDDHDELNGDEHEDEHKHDEHEGHEEDKHDEHSEISYEVRVIEIVARDDKFIGVNGLEEGEEYVSDKSYYVKSMMLKSSLGEHGH